MVKDYRLGLYEKAMPNTLSIQEKLIGARDAGFDFLELSLDESEEKLARLNMPANERTRLVSEMIKEGIHIETMCLSAQRRYPLGSIVSDIREKSKEILYQAIILAGDLGVRIVQIPGYDEYYNSSTAQTQEYFLEGIGKCVELAAQYGVVLGFETMELPFMNTVWKAMYWVKMINSPYLQIYPDSGNLTCGVLSEHGSVDDDLHSGAGHIAAMHLKESLPEVFRDVPYGQGHVNFERIIRSARSIGVRRFTGEFWYKTGIDWRQYILQNMEFLKAQF